jgi:hypothetical protein
MCQGSGSSYEKSQHRLLPPPQKRCSEHPGPWEVFILGTNCTACGAPVMGQEVTLSPGMGPDIVAEINVCGSREGAAPVASLTDSLLD